MASAGDKYVWKRALLKWLKGLSVDNLKSVEIGGDPVMLTGELRCELQDELETFRKFTAALPAGSDWRAVLTELSPMFLNAFVRCGDDAIRLANYYECLLVPANIITYRRMATGIDVSGTGRVLLRSEGRVIGEIGPKSSLITSVFSDCFIRRNYFGYLVNCPLPNSESFMTLQLYYTEGLSLDELQRLRDELLLKVCMELALDFSPFHVDSALIYQGRKGDFALEWKPGSLDAAAVSELLAAGNAPDPYQACRQCFRAIERLLPPDADAEEALLRAVAEGVDMLRLRNWLSSQTLRANYFCQGERALEPDADAGELARQITARLLYVREQAFTPKRPDMPGSMASREMELARFVAYEILSRYPARSGESGQNGTEDK